MANPTLHTTTRRIEVRGVRKRFGELTVLDRVDVSMPLPSRLAIVGPSGCGKSTLLSLVAGLLEPEAGTIRVAGTTRPRERLAWCALMPQKDLLLPWRTALDNACLALENRGVLAGKEVLLLDEPFGSLDSITRGQMQEWLAHALEQEPSR